MGEIASSHLDNEVKKGTAKGVKGIRLKLLV